ncbi:hypothetical protein CMV_027915 [Castanea mollissima]|uniref:TF-B3 domain-containing protein n=1 Tax=Castanea mollissima TaxID=60419 RepID=A0A8J4QHA5_9ROSI|nr:hypothetical protein CMV_027915 [Castanea mollissima]
MLTQEDFKGLYIDPNLSPFGYLLEVAKVAHEIFEKENKSVAAREPMIMEEDFKEKTQVARVAAGEERSKRNEPVTVKEKPLKIKTVAELGPEFESPPSKPIEEKPDLPNEYTDIITAKNGCELKLIIQKALSKTDLKKSANRLSIPNGQLKAEFLGQKEQIILQEKVGVHCKGIEVPLIQPSGEVSTILLKNWKYGNSNCYMLSSQWNKVAERNRLKADDIIQFGLLESTTNSGWLLLSYRL